MSVVHVIKATVNPSAAPDRTGQHWINESTSRTWLSVGNASVGDWLEVTTGAPQWVKYTLSHTDFQTAGLTNNAALLTLPIKGIVEAILIKTATAFTGGAITAYNLTIGITGNESKYLSSYSSFAAVTGSNYDMTNIINAGDDLLATESIKVFATSVGANLNSSTAGSVEIWVKTSTLT